MRKKIKTLAVMSTFVPMIGWTFAQSSQHMGHQKMYADQSQMMENCQMLSNQQQAMMSKMKTGDQELKSLVEKMQSTNGENQKIQVMENLLAKLVENRTQMHQHVLGKMVPQMMQHMSEHMQMAQKSGQSGMMNCPMMEEHHSPSEGSGTEDQGNRR